MFDHKKVRARANLDKRLTLDIPSKLPVPPSGYIRCIREALGMRANQFAQRMGIDRSTTSRLEKSEQLGSISLRRLRQAAEALECELVYAFVPKNRSLQEAVQRKAVTIAKAALAAARQNMALEGANLAELDEDLEVELYIQKHLTESEVWDLETD